MGTRHGRRGTTETFKMLTGTAATLLKNAAGLARSSSPIVRRNLGSSYVLLNQVAADPVQKLFADKVREYAQKKKAVGDKLVEATKEVEAELQSELDKVAKAYGGGQGVDMTAFPALKFQEPKLENLDIK